MVQVVYGVTPSIPYELLIIITVSCIFILIVVFQMRFLKIRKEELIENIKRQLKLQITLNRVRAEKYFELKSKKENLKEEIHEILISDEHDELKKYQKYIDNDSFLNMLGVRELERIKRQLDTIQSAYDLKTHPMTPVNSEMQIDDYDTSTAKK